jgi:hypothetical protein
MARDEFLEQMDPCYSHHGGEFGMKNWFKELMVILLARDRTYTPRRTDWRSRPVAGQATAPVSLPEGDPYATLRLPSLAKAPGLPPNSS